MIALYHWHPYELGGFVSGIFAGLAFGVQGGIYIGRMWERRRQQDRQQFAWLLQQIQEKTQ